MCSQARHASCLSLYSTQNIASASATQEHIHSAHCSPLARLPAHAHAACAGAGAPPPTTQTTHTTILDATSTGTTSSGAPSTPPAITTAATTITTPVGVLPSGAELPVLHLETSSAWHHQQEQHQLFAALSASMPLAGNAWHGMPDKAGRACRALDEANTAATVKMLQLAGWLAPATCCLEGSILTCFSPSAYCTPLPLEAHR